MAHKYQDEPLKPLLVLPALWSMTLDCVATARCGENAPRMATIAGQWAGTPVFDDPEDVFWTVSTFQGAVKDAALFVGNSLSRPSSTWKRFAIEAPVGITK